MKYLLLLSSTFLIMFSCTSDVAPSIDCGISVAGLKHISFVQELQEVKIKYKEDSTQQNAYADQLLVIATDGLNTCYEIGIACGPGKRDKPCNCCSGSTSGGKCENSGCCVVEKLNSGDCIFSKDELNQLDYMDGRGTIFGSVDTSSVKNLGELGFQYIFQLSGDYPENDYNIRFSEKGKTKRYSVNITHSR